MNFRRASLLGAGVAGGAGLAYLLQRTAAGRWRVGAEELAAAGLTLPPDLRHHFVTTSDGGRIHVVERGEGPTFVLVHGITLSAAAWAPQLHSLPGRVLAVSQRGHGQSRAGREGCTFERLAADLAEVLRELEVRDAVLVGHSMGGMVAQLLALDRPDDLSRHVRRLLLVASTPGPIAGPPLAALVAAASARALASAERRGRGPFPKAATVWASRVAFGASPSPAAVELLCEMLDSMSPGALAELMGHLLAFDVRERLAGLTVPVHVVVGTRDVLTPPRAARAIADRVPGSRLTLLPGCGHMVMLERGDTLCDLVTE